MLLLAFRPRTLAVHEHIPNLARVPRHCPPPTAKAAVRIHGLCPFVQIAALHLVLFRLLALGFQHEVIAALEAQQDIGVILPYDLAI